jgi:hypothetical protein
MSSAQKPGEQAAQVRGPGMVDSKLEVVVIAHSSWTPRP